MNECMLCHSKRVISCRSQETPVVPFTEDYEDHRQALYNLNYMLSGRGKLSFHDEVKKITAVASITLGLTCVGLLYANECVQRICLK